MSTNSRFQSINFTKLFLELVVVFLGVTAGFLLQNSKESSQQEDLEQKYLSGFLVDVTGNIEELKNLIELDSTWLAESRKDIEMIAKDSLTMDSANSLFLSLMTYQEFNEQSTTYQNIINSSSLNVIQDYELKRDLVDYHTVLNDFELMETYIKQFHSELILPYTMEHFDMFAQTFIEPDAHKSPAFKNIVGSYYSLISQRHDYYVQLLEASENLQKQLFKPVD